MTDIIKVEDLVKIHESKRGATPVLRGLSFRQKRGEFLCIMGPSGSGKSTLLHLLSGLDRPSSGRIFLDGQDLADLEGRDLTLKRRRSIGHVFQFFNLMPNLSCRENILLPLTIAGQQDAAGTALVETLIERFGLAARASALPHELSGGEMQRTSIARALAGGQELLLCDEPTGNLSQRAGREVVESLRQVKNDDGRSILLVTHNPRDATFADRVLFLVDGQIDTEQVLKGPDIVSEAVHEALSALSI